MTKSLKPGGIFDPESLRNEIEALETQTGQVDFWNDRARAGAILAQLKQRKRRLDPWVDLRRRFQDMLGLYELALEEQDQSLEEEIAENLKSIEDMYAKVQVLEFLGGEHDGASAFLTVHSGAGGTEACDWTAMLFRMYSRWAERQGYTIELYDQLEVEGGLKSVTALVKGEMAYGYLKAETGIHRLVRMSPFDSSGRRHTSFASVFCTPEIDDAIEVEINPDEIRVDTYRAAGAGGQHVNKTDSAVRMTHIPTGIVVQCQNERSQHKNKAMALKVLMSRVYEHHRRERDEAREKTQEEKKGISWGNQIRSYVFHPYTMVKDHRTKHEVGNIQAVMDGDLDGFIEEYLKLSWSIAQN